jgi:hypothetical protein
MGCVYIYCFVTLPCRVIGGTGKTVVARCELHQGIVSSIQKREEEDWIKSDGYRHGNHRNAFPCSKCRSHEL